MPTVVISDKMKEYMRKKGFERIAVSGQEFGSDFSPVEIVTTFITDPVKIELYEKSRYKKFEDDGIICYVNEQLIFDGEVAEIYLKRFLGAPDFRVKGLRFKE